MMRFFSDPAAASVELDMDGLSLGYDSSNNKGDDEEQLGSSPSTPTHARITRKNRISRVKSFDPSSGTGESPRMPAKVRNLRRSSTMGSSSGGGVLRDSASFEFGRRESMGDSSMGSGAGCPMQDHLAGIEAFCQVMKEAGSKERNRLLRQSLKAKQGLKSKDSR